jgi:hypothetical protein
VLDVLTLIIDGHAHDWPGGDAVWLLAPDHEHDGKTTKQAASPAAKATAILSLSVFITGRRRRRHVFACIASWSSPRRDRVRSLLFQRDR